jgi:hypothetical protein
MPASFLNSCIIVYHIIHVIPTYTGRTVSSISAETIFINMIRLQDLLAESRSPSIMDVIDQNLDYIARQFAESSPTYMGGGYYGAAYRVASGRILKITADTAEVTTAMRRRHRVPHLMSYYDIRSITLRDTPDREHDLYNTRFALLMDAVTPLTAAQQAIWSNIANRGFIGYFDPRTTTQQVIDLSTPSRFAAAADVPMYSNDFEFYQRVIAQRDGIMQATRRYNINPLEAHEKNVGVDSNGRITIYDMWTKPSTMRFDVGAVRVNRSVNELVSRLRNIQLQSTVFDATGIDTPGDPDM